MAIAWYSLAVSERANLSFRAANRLPHRLLLVFGLVSGLFGGLRFAQACNFRGYKDQIARGFYIRAAPLE